MNLRRCLRLRVAVGIALVVGPIVVANGLWLLAATGRLSSRYA